MFKKLLALFLCVCMCPISQVRAQPVVLPALGTMVNLSPSVNPSVLKGIKVHLDNPLKFDFILDPGSNRGATSDDATKLIRYFLAALTTPENDLWVNLSPYEKDRIVPNSFGQTEMGRDLLAQDYLLKQLTASLVYPEGDVGREFWKRIYQESPNKNIPVNTFNKVWIVPDKATIFENAQSGTAFVTESSLKVLTEQDYLAGEKNASSSTSKVVRDIVIPQLTKEVNEGANFASLRQVYQSLILATWYKNKIKDSILNQVYADKNKVSGINIANPNEKQKIYEQYLQAFKKGAYNYIKEEKDPITHKVTPRKYFSGGFNLAMTGVIKIDNSMTATLRNRLMQIARLITVGVVLTVSPVSTTLAQTLKFPTQASEEIKFKDWQVQRFFSQATSGDVQAISRLTVLSKRGNEEAIEAIRRLIYVENTQVSKTALEAFLVTPLDGVEHEVKIVRDAMRLQHKEAKDALSRLVKAGNIEASQYLIFNTEIKDPVREQAFKNLLSVLTSKNAKTVEWRGLVDALLRFYSNEPNNETLRLILENLAHEGDLYSTLVIIKSKLIRIDVNKLALHVMDWNGGDSVLLDYYQTDPSENTVKAIINYLFSTKQTFQNLLIILSDFNKTKEILELPEYKDRVPENPRVIVLLGALGHEKSFEFAKENQPDELSRLYYYRLELTARKGDGEALDRLEELASDEEEADKDALAILAYLSQRNDVSAEVKGRINNFIDDHFKLFVPIFTKENWQDYAKDPKHKANIQTLFEDLETNPNRLLALEWAGLLKKEHVARHPFSKEIFDSMLRNWPDMLKIYFKHSDDIHPVFSVLTQKWPQTAMSNILQRERSELQQELLKRLKDNNNLGAMANLFKTEEGKLAFLLQALKAENPQALPLLKSFVEEKPDRIETLYHVFSTGLVGTSVDQYFILNPQLEKILSGVDVKNFRFIRPFGNLDREESDLIFMGNRSVLEYVLKDAINSNDIANKLVDIGPHVPESLLNWLKNMDITPYAKNSALLRMFFLVGNAQATKLIQDGVSKQNNDIFAPVNVLNLTGFGDPMFKSLSSDAQAYLDKLRKDGMGDFKSNLRKSDTHQSNHILLKLYLAVLVNMQERFHLFDFETFKKISTQMIGRMTLTVDLNNANSGFEFGYRLILNLESIDEMLFVTGHEVAHNLLFAMTKDKIDGIKGDPNKILQYGSIHEYFADMVGFALVKDTKAIDKMMQRNFLCEFCAGLKTKEDWKDPMSNENTREVHYIPRYSRGAFLLMAKNAGIEPAKFLAAQFTENQNPILAYTGTYEDFYHYFFYTLALGLKVNYEYDPTLNIPSNIEKMLSLAKKNADSAQLGLSNTGGIDLNSTNLNLQNAGSAIKFNIDSAMLKQLQNAAGFTPTITSMKPTQDLLQFLGI